MRSTAPADLSVLALPVWELAVIVVAFDGSLLKVILFFWFYLSRKVISMLMKSAGCVCYEVFWLVVEVGLFWLAWK